MDCCSILFLLITSAGLQLSNGLEASCLALDRKTIEDGPFFSVSPVSSTGCEAGKPCTCRITGEPSFAWHFTLQLTSNDALSVNITQAHHPEVDNRKIRASFASYPEGYLPEYSSIAFSIDPSAETAVGSSIQLEIGFGNLNSVTVDCEGIPLSLFSGCPIPTTTAAPTTTTMSTTTSPSTTTTQNPTSTTATTATSTSATDTATPATTITTRPIATAVHDTTTSSTTTATTPSTTTSSIPDTTPRHVTDATPATITPATATTTRNTITVPPAIATPATATTRTTTTAIPAATITATTTTAAPAPATSADVPSSSAVTTMTDNFNTTSKYVPTSTISPTASAASITIITPPTPAAEARPVSDGTPRKAPGGSADGTDKEGVLGGFPLLGIVCIILGVCLLITIVMFIIYCVRVRSSKKYRLPISVVDKNGNNGENGALMKVFDDRSYLQND